MKLHNTNNTYQATKKYFMKWFNSIWELPRDQSNQDQSPEKQSRHHFENSFDYLACNIGVILVVSAFFGAFPAATSFIVGGFCLFLLIEGLSHRFNEMGAIANIHRTILSVALACGSALVLAGVFIVDCLDWAVKNIADGYSIAFAHGYFPGLGLPFINWPISTISYTTNTKCANHRDQSTPKATATSPCKQTPGTFT